MKKILFLAGLLLSSIASHAQLEENIWTFGDKAGLDFTTAIPSSYINNLFPGEEGCASVCNSMGQTLFYTDGFWVWDKHHSLMPRLTGGTPGYTAPISLSVGYPPLMPYTGAFATQAAAICSAPGHPGQYYLFSLNTNGQLFYSIVDTSLNSGAGDLVSGKMEIYVGGGLAEKMAVVKGCNNIWLVVRSKTANQYKSYQIRDTGINLSPVISSIGSLPISWYQCGVIKFTPDATKMAAACNYGSTNAGGLELYDFNYRTGVLANPHVLDSSSTTGYYYGACFSPDNTKLYATTSSYRIGSSFYPGKVRQFNVSLGSTAAIVASNTILYTDTVQLADNLGDLKRGLDGKIYLGSGRPDGMVSYMHQIALPNIAGVACNFVPNAITLSSGMWSYRGLPNDVVIWNGPDTVKTAYSISVCFRDSMTITALDVLGKEYIWANGATENKIRVHTNGIFSVGYVNSNCKYQVDLFKVNFVHVPSISPDKYSCNGKKQGLAWVKPASSDTTTFLFTWLDANGNILQQRTTNVADTIAGLDTGSYTVQVHTTGGCDTNLHVRILGIPSPSASATIDSIVCKGNGSAFSGHTDGIEWKWYFGDGTTSDSLASEHFYKQGGDYDVLFVTKNIEGCSDTIIRYVQVKTFVIILSSDKDNINLGEQVKLQTSGSEPYVVTEWEPANLFADQTALAQVFQLDTTKTFLVLGQSAYGCIDTAMLTISVNPQVFIPSAFSPNSDGLNDRFRPRTAGAGVFIDDFEVYNRWGQLVWYGYGSNAAEGWDGKFHGVDAEIGTYFFTIHMVTPSGGTIYQKGDVTLIR